MSVSAGMSVREITDEEVADCDEYGWVKLPEFIPAAFAAELFEVAKELKEQSEAGWESAREDTAWKGYRDFGDWIAIVKDNGYFQARLIRVEPFWSFTVSKEMGRAGQSIM